MKQKFLFDLFLLQKLSFAEIILEYDYVKLLNQFYELKPQLTIFLLMNSIQIKITHQFTYNLQREHWKFNLLVQQEL